ncbi:hypothetical protein RRG08_011177 [Elysia crispata]|uniref:Uncharacterized protein n=1 Tax=Elysia crispata TaxID=231223 RepID=A0AAE0Z0S0_9GAST|nr:hypothetical protein RRG08_011177 [Elysia crispata]
MTILRLSNGPKVCHLPRLHLQFPPGTRFSFLFLETTEFMISFLRVRRNQQIFSVAVLDLLYDRTSWETAQDDGRHNTSWYWENATQCVMVLGERDTMRHGIGR